MSDDTEKLLAVVQLGGERGRKLALRSFFRAIMAGHDEAAFKFLKAAVSNMPKEDKEYVLSAVTAFSEAMSYEDPEDDKDEDLSRLEQKDSEYPHGRLAKWFKKR
jgi:hypothetical protein